MFRVKIDGEEREVDEEEARRLISLSGAAFKRMEEAATVKKQMQAFEAAFERDPVSVLQALSKAKGKDAAAFKEHLAQYLLRDLEEQQLSPEARRVKELEAQLAEREQAQATEKEKRYEAALAARAEQESARYQSEISTALQGSRLPKSAAVVSRIAYHLERGLDLGWTPAQAVKIVEREYATNLSAMLGELEGDALEQALGETIVKKLQAHAVKKLQAGQASPSAKGNGEQPRSTKPAPPKFLSEKEFRQKYGM